MKERPILFNGAMVRAVLADTKTQTRRLVKPQPDVAVVGPIPGSGVCGRFTPDDMRLGRIAEAMSCPYGEPGDRLYVRETFALEHAVEHDQKPPHNDGRPTKWSDDPEAHRWVQAHYRATDPNPDLAYDDEASEPQCRWTPSIHMPRWASRIDLEVTGVRVERMQDISEADAKAEGAEPIVFENGSAADRGLIDLPLMEVGNPYRNGFAALWESINGPGSWDANPWVWVVEFRRLP